MASQSDQAGSPGDPGEAVRRRERVSGQPAATPAESTSGRPGPRRHPQPPLDQVHPSSLNDAVRQELWYLDSMVAAPFRLARRYARASRPQDGPPHEPSPLRLGADELLWAAEGMARLPLKLLQAAFGEPPPSGSSGGAPRS